MNTTTKTVEKRLRIHEGLSQKLTKEEILKRRWKTIPNATDKAEPHKIIP